MKLWLTGITNKGNRDHLVELIEPIKEYFDGLIWVYHLEDQIVLREIAEDDGFQYLVQNQKEGKIVLSEWCNRFDFSRNTGLFRSPIKNGDWFVTIDTMERMHPEFAAQLPELIQRFTNNNINGVYLRNKHFLFQYNENTAFVNNPHCGVAGVKNSLEITTLPFWRDEFWQNVRNQHRSQHDFIDHNLKYYLFPNTNHLVLNCEHDRDFMIERYMIRSEFFNELKELDIDPQDFNAVKEYICSGDLTNSIKKCIAEEKYLNDVYRFYRLKREDIEEDFDFENLVDVK